MLALVWLIAGAAAAVTFDVSPVTANNFRANMQEEYQMRKYEHVVELCDEYKELKCTDVLQSAGGSENGVGVPSPNGFVHGVVRAYNAHHHLIVRPDDVWLAIMMQFGLYVNKHADDLRDRLVKHQDGTKELEIKEVGTENTVHFGKLAARLIGEMKAHLVDPDLGDWIVPAFSTTTDHDRIVGSIVMLATMEKYFTYKVTLACGIPTVTLLGTAADWQDLRRRVDRFVAAANGSPDVAFWQRIAHTVGGGSGPSYLSGWITVFSVFDAQGDWQGDRRDVTVPVLTGDPSNEEFQSHDESIGGEFPLVEIDDVAPGYLTVDVTIDDFGEIFKSVMFAGHMSFDVVGGNAIQPALSWAIAIKESSCQDGVCAAT